MIRLSLLALSVLLLPTLAYADAFHAIDGRTVFQARDKAYRLRSPNKPWQLTELSGVISGSVTVGEAVYTLAGGQTYKTTDGLRYESIALPVLAGAIFHRVDNQTFLAGTVGGTVRIWQITEAGFEEQFSHALENPTAITFMASLNQELILPVVQGGTVRLLRQTGSTWVLTDSITCEAATIFTAPLLGVSCAGGQTYQVDGSLLFVPLFTAPVEGLSVGKGVIGAFAQTSHQTIWLATATQVMSIELTGGEPPTQLTSLANRVLLHFSTGLYELNWQMTEPTLTPITALAAQPVEVNNDGAAVFLSANTSAFFSNLPGQWQLLNAQGNFNRAQRVPTGWFVWQTNDQLTSGGLAQFLATGTTSLQKVNPWASTTSPVQAVSLDTSPSYVSVVTSSGTGNTNLYRSTDYRAWSRITLPTRSTLVRTIGEARLLAADSLVELNGVVSVPPGIVGAEIVYIQDNTGGIQVFLSSSKGVLPSETGRQVTITGEVSASEVERIVLEERDDLVSGGIGQVADRVINPADVSQLWGWTGRLTDRISVLETDNLTVSEQLKIHLDSLGKSAKEVFRLRDLIELPVVVDWNSSSGKTEAWYLGRDYRILERAELVTPAATKPKATAKSTKKTTTKNTSAPKKASAGAAPKVASTRTPTARVAATRATAVRPEPSQKPDSRPSSSQTAMGFLSLAAGMLVMRGRRFRQLLQ